MSIMKLCDIGGPNSAKVAIRSGFVRYMQDKLGCTPKVRNSMVNETFPSCFTLSGGPDCVDRYLRGDKKTKETSVVVQPCHRFWDIGAVGDGRHLSFFEMAVTNSFNGIPREEMYRAHFKFLTEEIGLNPDYFTLSVFGGGEIYGSKFEPDDEAVNIWKGLGVKRFSISQGFGYSPAHLRLVNSSFVANSVEPVGGPRTEICYGDLEVWTSVHYNTFVTYDRENNRFSFSPIQESTVAAGFGLERLVQAAFGLPSINSICQSKKANDKAADAIKGLVFLGIDGAFELTGNKNSGRKTLLNRQVGYLLGNIEKIDILREIVDEAIGFYSEAYPELVGKAANITEKILARARRLDLIGK